MRSLAEITLPPQYGLTVTADGAELLLPNGHTLHHYGEAYSPLAIEGDAWAHYLAVSRSIEELDRLMERGWFGPAGSNSFGGVARRSSRQ